jgi:DNA-binding GntR family transcriptional regulator
MSSVRLRESMVSPRSVEESVTETLRDAILGGDLKPGQRLAQVELSEELGVSRIPLRDALRRLEAEGLVTIDRRRGARVSSLTADDVQEIYEMRMLLEGDCARRAISSLGDDDVERLVRLSEEMDRTADDPTLGSESRRRFYSELYALAGRPRMHAVILELRALVVRYHLLTDSGGHHRPHDDLRSCLRERDGERGAAVICAHLDAARRDLIQSLEPDEEE